MLYLQGGFTFSPLNSYLLGVLGSEEIQEEEV